MGLWQKLSHWLLPEPPVEASLAQAVDHAIGVVDPNLRMLGGLEHRLAPAIQSAMSYCAELVAQLPPPLQVSHPAFASDPLVHALFASADDIDVMLGRSAAIRDFLDDGTNAFTEHCYAMLGMRRREKTMIGLAQQGDVIRSDVPLRYLYFTDHTLLQLALTEDETRRRLQITAFDSLLQQYAQVVADQRRVRDEQRIAWDTERASGAGHMTPDEKAWRLSALEAKYHESTEQLTPERILDGLVQWLETAPQRLYLEPSSVTVDNMGMLVEPSEDRSDVHTLFCPQLVGRDRRKWTVILVRIARQEAWDAVEEQARQEQLMRSLWI